MAKNKPMILIKISGYTPACDIMDRKSIDEMHEKLSGLKDFADTNLTDAKFTKKQVNRLVEETKDEPQPEAQDHAAAADALGDKEAEVPAELHVHEGNTEEE